MVRQKKKKTMAAEDKAFVAFRCGEEDTTNAKQTRLMEYNPGLLSHVLTRKAYGPWVGDRWMPRRFVVVVAVGGRGGGQGNGLWKYVESRRLSRKPMALMIVSGLLADGKWM